MAKLEQTVRGGDSKLRTRGMIVSRFVCILRFTWSSTHTRYTYCCLSCVSLFLFPSLFLSWPFFSSSLVIAQIGGHITSASPSPYYVLALLFSSVEHFRPFLPRRLASDCPSPRLAPSAVEAFLFLEVASPENKARHSALSSISKKVRTRCQGRLTSGS